MAAFAAYAEVWNGHLWGAAFLFRRTDKAQSQTAGLPRWLRLLAMARGREGKVLAANSFPSGSYHCGQGYATPAVGQQGMLATGLPTE